MGIIILTADDKDYRIGDCVVMHGEMTSPPTAPKTTYILHTRSFTEKDILDWQPYVSHRLVIVLKKAPQLSAKSEDFVIVDKSLKTFNAGFKRNLQAMFRWGDRTRALPLIKDIPLPLADSFFRINRDEDMETARRLADVRFMLPDEYASAIFAYSVKARQEQMVWPQKKVKEEDKPSRFRESDQYTDILLENAEEISNLIRQTEPEALPASLPKKQRSLVEWL